MAYLSTKSAFLPWVGAALYCSHRFSAGMVSVVGVHPPKLAPGMSSSQRALLWVLAMASLYLSVGCTHPLSAAQPQHMLCIIHDCSQNHFRTAHGFIALHCSPMSMLEHCSTAAHFKGRLRLVKMDKTNILINAHALLAVNSNYRFLINE